MWTSSWFRAFKWERKWLVFLDPSVYDSVSLMSSSFPIIWILLKWAFEVANYWTGSMLRSFEFHLLRRVSVGGPRGWRWYWWVVVWGWGEGEGCEQPACNTWEAPCLHYQWHQTGKRKGGWGGELCAAVMRTAVCWNRVTAMLHNNTQSNTISHTDTLFSSFSHS